MAKETPTVFLVDPELPADHLILDGIDTSREPRFSVSEVAKFFFKRNSHWVRWAERKGIFVFEGEDVGTGRTESGSRVYALADIEKMAHALAAKDLITQAQLSFILHLVYFEAKLWGYV